MRPSLALLALVTTACSYRTPPPPAPSSSAAAVARGSPRTAEECRACRGDWGVHGIADTESCICRTSDGGKRCTDGIDCQGACIASIDNPEHEVVEAGPPLRGFFVGRCSELVTVFGCNRFIDRGARARGPVPLAEQLPTMCVD